MATVLDCLQSINTYPVQLRTFTEVAERRGVDLTEEATAELLKGAAFSLCRADILLWLSYAPAVSQGGISYSFTDEQRTQMRNEAQQIYKEQEEEHLPKTIYGYKGNRL